MSTSEILSLIVELITLKTTVKSIGVGYFKQSLTITGKALKYETVQSVHY